MAFHDKMLAWFDEFGRHDLPWQSPRSPYRVWLSEIMLQQTQVTTVIPYFKRFIKAFPNVKRLAMAPMDDVLALWSGLGYYARARNLHKAAGIVHRDYRGQFPITLVELMSLPGVGRSTAGAILAMGFEIRAPILDGNVKRVLARYRGVEGWPGAPAVAEQLWAVSSRYTPDERVRDYTQAMMDLGAMVCTRSKPKCDLCPIRGACVARKQNQIEQFPGRKPKKDKPVRAAQFLVCIDDNKVLLQKRSEKGIWGGLWSLPECDVDSDVTQFCHERWHIKNVRTQTLIAFRHTFTHYHLEIVPVKIKARQWPKPFCESERLQWYSLAQASQLGLPAPVRQILLGLGEPCDTQTL